MNYKGALPMLQKKARKYGFFKTTYFRAYINPVEAKSPDLILCFPSLHFVSNLGSHFIFFIIQSLL